MSWGAGAGAAGTVARPATSMKPSMAHPTSRSETALHWPSLCSRSCRSFSVWPSARRIVRRWGRSPWRWSGAGSRSGSSPAFLVALGSVIGDSFWAAVGILGSSLLTESLPLRMVIGVARRADPAVPGVERVPGIAARTPTTICRIPRASGRDSRWAWPFRWRIRSRCSSGSWWRRPAPWRASGWTASHHVARVWFFIGLVAGAVMYWPRALRDRRLEPPLRVAPTLMRKINIGAALGLVALAVFMAFRVVRLLGSDVAPAHHGRLQRIRRAAARRLQRRSPSDSRASWRWTPWTSPSGGAGARAGRRERGRQVHAPQDRRGRRPAGCRARVALDGQPVSFAAPRDALAPGSPSSTRSCRSSRTSAPTPTSSSAWSRRGTACSTAAPPRRGPREALARPRRRLRPATPGGRAVGRRAAAGRAGAGPGARRAA